MKGIIKKIDDDRGFGFITVEGQKDIFFHATDCTQENFKSMKAGDTVSFDMGDSDKGPKAINVMLVEDMGQEEEDMAEAA